MHARFKRLIRWLNIFLSIVLAFFQWRTAIFFRKFRLQSRSPYGGFIGQRYINGMNYCVTHSYQCIKIVHINFVHIYSVIYLISFPIVATKLLPKFEIFKIMLKSVSFVFPYLSLLSKLFLIKSHKDIYETFICVIKIANDKFVFLEKNGLNFATSPKTSHRTIL